MLVYFDSEILFWVGSKPFLLCFPIACFFFVAPQNMVVFQLMNSFESEDKPFLFSDQRALCSAVHCIVYQIIFLNEHLTALTSLAKKLNLIVVYFSSSLKHPVKTLFANFYGHYLSLLIFLSSFSFYLE